MSVEICVLSKTQFKGELGGGGAAELKIQKSRSIGIVQTAKPLSFLS